MLNRPLIVGLLVLVCAGGASRASATIDVIVSLLDGEVSLHNPEEEPFEIMYYSITSDGDWLLPGGWTPIAIHYDVSGDQSVDPDDEWILLSNPGTVGFLSETELFGNGGILEPGQTVSLGLIWDTSSDQDLEAEISDTSEIPTDVVFDYRSYDADFNLDLDVDSEDLSIWEANYGTFGAIHSQGDADRNGVVDGVDLIIWHEQLISNSPGSGAGRPAMPNLGASVPEPSTFWLAAIAVALGFFGKQRRKSVLRWNGGFL